MKFSDWITNRKLDEMARKRTHAPTAKKVEKPMVITVLDQIRSSIRGPNIPTSRGGLHKLGPRKNNRSNQERKATSEFDD